MEKHFLLFTRNSSGGHAVVYFVRAGQTTQAIRLFVQQQNPALLTREDGSLSENGLLYSHPLAYVEAVYKTHGEWQIRTLPDWTLQELVTEVFCGESEDGPTAVIAVCRRELVRHFPRSRARAFHDFALDVMTHGYPRPRLDHMMKIRLFGEDENTLYHLETEGLSDRETLRQMPAHRFAALLFDRLLQMVRNPAFYNDKPTFDERIFQPYIALMFVYYATTDPYFYR